MLLAEKQEAAEQVVQEALRLFEEPTLSSCAGSAGSPRLASGCHFPRPAPIPAAARNSPGDPDSGPPSPAVCCTLLGMPQAPTLRSCKMGSRTFHTLSHLLQVGHLLRGSHL